MYPEINHFSEDYLKKILRTKIDIRILERIPKAHSIKIAYDYFKENRDISFYACSELGTLGLEYKNKNYKVKYIQFPEKLNQTDNYPSLDLLKSNTMNDKTVSGWIKLLLDTQKIT